MSTYIAVQTEDFDLNQLYTGLRCASGANGAIVTFTGLVRELSNTTHLQALYLEHYPGMTEKALQSIVDQARERWPLGQVTLIHRVGRLALNEQIVFVGASSPHRADAFAAVEFMMDYLKQDAPFWKKEITSSGEHWVEQKTSDLAAAKRWR
ncbi:molybdopterin synthase catalytic subunit MoaE [Neptuniibacter sp. CAU 1671]|uniref:molybdopterin synthase catalytic subunit MoaE n=1 Tax=Neptuniibacter sp. CAU 1671 TaxID=3032593 RepID=UPI0023DA056A|nr:molybdopterin synthase catalytic subunit MoaE [Neptuniibacter sp. CAU 1671]MDF2180470.1 molybdopterin synthase catalytic subunit MoaE [Neptuniibacter sp. CAU 1671]